MFIPLCLMTNEGKTLDIAEFLKGLAEIK